MAGTTNIASVPEGNFKLLEIFVDPDNITIMMVMTVMMIVFLMIMFRFLIRFE
jgi:hypothetical protein